MKTFFTLFPVLLKRLSKKPLLIITLLLIPLSVLFLVHTTKPEDSILKVAIYCPDAEQDSPSQALTDTLMSLSNSAIRFCPVEKQEMVYQAIENQSADCGYLIPDDLDRNIASYIKNGTSILTAVHADDEMSTKVIDEIVLSKVYRIFSYQFVEHYLTTKLDAPVDTSSLKTSYDKYCKDELLFSFEYTDGQKEKDLSKTTNFLLLPLRGLLSVMILLVCLCSNFLWYEDQKTGLSKLLFPKAKHCFSFLSLLIPAFFAGALGLLSLYLSHIAENTFSELGAIAGLLVACMGLSYLLRNLLPSLPMYLACIPLLIVSSLILCPVFISLGSFFPAISQISRIFPTRYYLEALHYPQSLYALYGYGIITFLLGYLLSTIRNRFV